MQVFFSHHSRNKPLLREIKAELPEHVAVAIDEDIISAGQDFLSVLRDEIDTKTDYLVVFLDEPAVESEYVQKEVEWARNQEAVQGREIVIPVELVPETWKQLVPGSTRLAIRPSPDLSKEWVRALAWVIERTLFEYADAELSRLRSPVQTVSPKQEMNALADEIRLITCDRRRANPIELADLFEELKRARIGTWSTLEHFRDEFVEMQGDGLLAGIERKGGRVYSTEDNYFSKRRRSRDAKRLIAEKAADHIESEYTIALDGGTTTLEVVQNLLLEIRRGDLSGIKVLTNSVPAAEALLNASCELGLSDDTPQLQVYVMGGRARHTTLSVVPGEGAQSGFQEALSNLGPADVSFVGTNGIDEHGFTTYDPGEAESKTAIIAGSKKVVILSDPTKFGTAHEERFATWDDDIELLTVKQGFDEQLHEHRDWLHAHRSKIRYADEAT